MPALLSNQARRLLLRFPLADFSIPMAPKRRSEKFALRVAFLHPDLGLGGEPRARWGPCRGFSPFPQDMTCT